MKIDSVNDIGIISARRNRNLVLALILLQAWSALIIVFAGLKDGNPLYSLNFYFFTHITLWIAIIGGITSIIFRLLKIIAKDRLAYIFFSVLNAGLTLLFLSEQYFTKISISIVKELLAPFLLCLLMLVDLFDLF